MLRRNISNDRSVAEWRRHRSIQGTRIRGQRGFSLIELMVSLILIALLLGGVAVSLRAGGRAGAKATASKLAAAIRYTYDRAVTTGSYFRIVIDMSTQSYWAERSDDRYYLVRGKEESPGRGKAPDEAERERKRKEEEDKRKLQVQGLAAQLQPPPEPKRARFQAFKDSTLPKVILDGAKVRDVYTRRQSEAYTDGVTYLYFFPDGHTERALIHVEGKSGDVFTLLVHPLTGRVEIKSGDLPLPRDFDLDAEGRDVNPQ